MHDHGNTFATSLSVFAFAGLSGLSARLARDGWTPEAIASCLGALAALGMTCVSLLRAAWPYFDRITRMLAPHSAPKPKDDE